MPCCFISTRSASIALRVTALPRRGSWSWRFTPLTSTGRPLTSSSWPTTSTRRKPDVERDRVDLGAVGVEQGDGEAVEVRRLGAPRRDVGHDQLEHGAAPFEEQPVRRACRWGARSGPARRASRPPSSTAHASTRGARGRRRPIHTARAQPAVAGGRVVVGGRVHVGDVDRRRRVDEDAAVQAGVVPVVLVLEVGRVRPAHDT